MHKYAFIFEHITWPVNNRLHIQLQNLYQGFLQWATWSDIVKNGFTFMKYDINL